MGPKIQGRWREFATWLVFSVFRVGDGAAMTIGKPEMHAIEWGVIQFIRRLIVAKPVPAIIGEPSDGSADPSRTLRNS